MLRNLGLNSEYFEGYVGETLDFILSVDFFFLSVDIF
jgi:hypothetical protein